MVRINKYLADCGICSRREADKYIDSGKVKINGQIAKSGMQVDDKDIVEFDGKQIRSLESKVVLAYYKPIGVTCTEKDKHAKKTIVDAIKYPVRLTYAGRLDKDSEGLIIMTNDGELINNMMRGANRHEKEYIVKVDRTINPEFVEKMSKGVFLKDLSQTTRPCEVEIIGKNTFKIILTLFSFSFSIASIVEGKIIPPGFSVVSVPSISKKKYFFVIIHHPIKLYHIPFFE